VEDPIFQHRAVLRGFSSPVHHNQAIHDAEQSADEKRGRRLPEFGPRRADDCRNDQHGAEVNHGWSPKGVDLALAGLGLGVGHDCHHHEL